MPKPARRKKATPSPAEEHRIADAPSTFLPDYSVAIVETVREPLVVLDAGLGCWWRHWVSRVLRDCGYTVLECRNGGEALRLFAANTADVRLLLIDLVMPGAAGGAVGEKMAIEAPDVPVVYISAYTEDEIKRRRLLPPGSQCLHKPFSPWQLAQRVRAALDAGS
jgi:CheY-like chemotaxis protein